MPPSPPSLSRAHNPVKSVRRLTVLLPLFLAIAAVCSSSPLLGASAKLLVRNARLFTMAPQQRDPFIGYLVVAEDGTITAVAAGDPPPGLNPEKILDAHGDWIIPGFLSAHSHLWQ